MSSIRPGITVLIIYLILAAIPAAVFAAPNEAGYTKVITENYNGKTIHVKQGETFYLRLKENPSTGYSWQLSLRKGLNLLSTGYYPPESSKNGQRLIVGAAGFHSWKIKAISKGSQQVKGIYRRSWEKETGKEQTFTLNVKVV
jgi:inhibitor of cysteine peptidase